MKPKLFFLPVDWIIIFFALLLCVLSIILLSGNEQGSPILSVNSLDEEFLYQLDIDQTVSIQGKKGLSVIQISQGEAFFIDSPCANHTCIASPAISRNGEWAACLPNGIFLSVRTKKPEVDIDIIAF